MPCFTYLIIDVAGSAAAAAPPVARREAKEQVVTMNFHLPAAPYDFRIMVNVEDSLGKVTPDANAAAAEAAAVATAGGTAAAVAAAAAGVPSDWTSKRRRRRVSWSSSKDAPADAMLHWRLDATVVEVTEAGEGEGGDGGDGERTQTLEVSMCHLLHVLLCVGTLKLKLRLWCHACMRWLRWEGLEESCDASIHAVRFR